MDPHEHANLLAAARRGDRRSRERLVAEYLCVVRAIAFRYRDLGVPLDDLLQEGSLGLLEAIDRFDPARSTDFQAFARFRIRRAIRNALTEQSRLVRLPKQVVERRRAIDAAAERVRSSTGRQATSDELAAATGLTPATVVTARGAGAQPVSLDDPVLEDGSTLESLVADGSARDPADETVEHERALAVDEAVQHLTPRQREIVTRHFGLGCDAEQIAEVAATLHVSQQRARAIERDALFALRDELEPVVEVPPAP